MLLLHSYLSFFLIFFLISTLFLPILHCFQFGMSLIVFVFGMWVLPVWHLLPTTGWLPSTGCGRCPSTTAWCCVSAWWGVSTWWWSGVLSNDLRIGDTIMTLVNEIKQMIQLKAEAAIMAVDERCYRWWCVAINLWMLLTLITCAWWAAPPP